LEIQLELAIMLLVVELALAFILQLIN